MPRSKYRQWLTDVAAIRDWDANDMAADDTYDYELFYNHNRKDAENMLKEDSEAHFDDIGKTAKHPTFSNESYYSGRRSIKNPRGIVGGRWSENNGRWKYTLSQSQINNNWDIPRTIAYLEQAENNGVELRLPNGRMPIINGIRFGGVLPELVVIPNKRK